MYMKSMCELKMMVVLNSKACTSIKKMVRTKKKVKSFALPLRNGLKMRKNEPEFLDVEHGASI